MLMWELIFLKKIFNNLKIENFSRESDIALARSKEKKYNQLIFKVIFS